MKLRIEPFVSRYEYADMREHKRLVSYKISARVRNGLLCGVKHEFGF